MLEGISGDPFSIKFFLELHGKNKKQELLVLKKDNGDPFPTFFFAAALPALNLWEMLDLIPNDLAEGASAFAVDDTPID
jgi:hypothetical protein